MRAGFRWQIALAAIGVIAVAVVLSLFATRTFVDRPARGGQVVEAVVGRPAVVNPLLVTKSVEEDLARLIFAGLTRPSAQGEPEADLASRWEISEDGLNYTFFLRDGLTWQDGEPLTAADVVFTAGLTRDARLKPSLSRSALTWSEADVTAVDEHTVTFTLKEAYAPFLADTSLGIVPEHILADVRPPELAQHRFSTVEPVGAGPYKLVIPGGLDEQGARLERFDGHWQATDQQPYLDRLDFQFFADSEEAIDALGRQVVQSAGGIPGSAVNGLSGGTDLYTAAESGYALIYLNHRRVLFEEPDVRQALSLAVDRASIISDPAIVAGQGIAAAGPIPHGSWAFDEEVTPPEYDPVAARRILETALWTDSDGDGVRDREGQSLVFTLGVGPDPVLLAIGERAKRDWEAIGVGVTVQTMDREAVQSALTNHEYDAMVFNWVLSDYDPDPFPLWHSSQIPEGQNYAGWSNAEADRLLADARLTVETQPRAELYSEFSRLFALEQPSVILYHPLYTHGFVAGEVGGVQAPRLLVRPADRFLTLRDWFVETERVVAGD